MQRRELFSFLSSAAKGEGRKEKPIRPPYYESLDVFGNGCQKCDGVCAIFCQEQIIVIGEDKTPRLDFSKGGCTYCDKCATICEFGVLSLEFKKEIEAIVFIDEQKCMSWQGVMCFSCKDPCLEDAIEFKAMFMPKIDMAKCTACGFCINRCPSYAINIIGVGNQEIKD